MINQYPLWKNLLILAVLLISVIYALPNVYGEDPALQITNARAGKLEAGIKDRVANALKTAGLDYKSIESNDQEILVRFHSTEVQLKAVDFIKATLGSQFVVALNLAPSTPKWLQSILPLSLTFTSIPYFMFGILLISVFAFKLHWLPPTGGYSRDVDPGWNLPFIQSVASHGVLPLISIILTSMGGWALGMRGLMIGVNNEDYFLLAQAKGLPTSRVFYRYGIRNAILPALTAFALGLGGLIGGSILVEWIFAYPGTGYTLYRAIQEQDYTVIQTITNLMIIITATGVLVLDLLYPLIDPRITFRRSSAS